MGIELGCRVKKRGVHGEKVLVEGLLWGFVILLVVVWVLGKLVFGIVSGLIHLLLVIAVVVIIYKLIKAGAARGT
jgi:Family of unknown function (DUF5670)